jgi:hypothetical protein
MRAVERLDDHHPAAAARARRWLDWRFGVIGTSHRVGTLRRRSDIEQFSTQREVLGAMAVGEQAIVADAMEAVWKHVHQEAAHELAGSEGHDLVLAAVIGAIVLPSESDMLVGEFDEPAVADGHAVRIAREIGQHLRRHGERLLGEYDPFPRAVGSQVGHKDPAILEAGEFREELKFARVEGRCETFEEQAAEQTRQHPDGQEEPRPASHPACAIGREAAARHDAMDVGMMIEVLSPGVQDGGEADLSAEMPGIAGDRRQRLCGGLEQEPVDLGLILERDGGDRSGQREHDVEIGSGQEFGLARLHPSLRRRPLALRTMAVAARVVGDARIGAILTSLDMTAERFGATNLDSRHDATLGEAQMGLVCSAPGVAVAAEHVATEAGSIARSDGTNLAPLRAKLVTLSF